MGDEKKELSEKLDTLIKLFGLFTLKDIETKKDQVLFLLENGFSVKEIALMTGNTVNYVRVTISQAKKK